MRWAQASPRRRAGRVARGQPGGCTGTHHEAEASLAEANAQLESVTQEAGALRARLDASLFSAETEEDRQQIVDTLNRGFYARAKLAIQGGDASGLENCFSDSFLRTDPSITLSLAGDAPFHAYSIASSHHELTWAASASGRKRALRPVPWKSTCRNPGGVSSPRGRIPARL